MTETNVTSDSATAQPGAETSATLAVSVEDAAAHFGISPQAVRKRIAAHNLPAERVGRAWRVYLPAQPEPVSETTTRERLREATKPANTKPVAQSQREQFALMVEPIIAPWAAKVEALSREAERNLARAELAEQRLAAAARERDDLRRLAEDALLAYPPDEPHNAPQSPETAQDAPARR